MYYRFSTFFKRDANFVYDQEINEVSWLKLRSGDYLDIHNPLIFTIDKIDAYIGDYDVLPTIGIPLVSRKWKETFCDLNEKEFQLLDVIIRDNSGNINNNFFALNILHRLPCLDKEKSIFEIDEDGDFDIKKFYIRPESLLSYSIVRMEEDTSYIIVTENFKTHCEKAFIKGLNFTEEGYSIYKDV